MLNIFAGCTEGGGDFLLKDYTSLLETQQSLHTAGTARATSHLPVVQPLGTACQVPQPARCHRCVSVSARSDLYGPPHQSSLREAGRKAANYERLANMPGSVILANFLTANVPKWVKNKPQQYRLVFSLESFVCRIHVSHLSYDWIISSLYWVRRPW